MQPAKRRPQTIIIVIVIRENFKLRLASVRSYKRFKRLEKVAKQCQLNVTQPAVFALLILGPLFCSSNGRRSLCTGLCSPIFCKLTENSPPI
jgi:hypothetical protein